MTTLADIRILNRLAQERARQDVKWGEQNHPDGTGRVWDFCSGQHDGWAKDAADDARRRCQEATDKPWGDTYALILNEEVFEAFAEDDPAKVAVEVEQVGAVAVAWLGAIERRSAARPIRVYISGPIKDDPHARAKFAAAQETVNSWGGYEAVNPFDVAPLSHPGEACGEGYQPGMEGGEHTSSACFMRTDLLALLSCDAILLLDGWENSKGVAVELAVAKACGMHVTTVREAVAS